jgi:hydrogenase maturation protease
LLEVEFAVPRLPTALPSGVCPSRVLIIGWGNSLCGDDGAGPHIAEEAGKWAIPGVVALPVHELVPELAADLASAQAAFFIDAALDCPATEMLPLPQTDEDVSHLDHAIAPASLLTLSRRVFGRAPPAWIMRVPAEDFTLGHGFSERTRGGIDTALRLLAQRL